MVPYLLIFALALSARSSSAATIHVPADQPTIQDGIDATTYGDLVLVAPGTYTENITFRGKVLTLRSEAGAGATVIDGNQAGTVVTFDGGETRFAVLEGFTITNGMTSLIGGGIYCEFWSGPTITNCTISDNSTDYSGGGIGCFQSSPTITHCTITKNIADDYGGGLFCDENADPTITSCTISDNSAELFGGGIYGWESGLVITDSTVSGNTSGSSGGGFYFQLSLPVITNCLITENSSGSGGGIELSTAAGTIMNCAISGNTATWSGGGLMIDGCAAHITNCLITGNTAASDGGGIFAWGDPSPYITHCTISGNSASKGGGIYSFDAAPQIVNSILWGDGAPAGPEIYVGGFVAPYPPPEISYSDVQGGHEDVFFEPGFTVDWGNGNIDAAPLFIGWGNYHLRPGSPCINAGTNAGVDLDIDGQARPYGAGFDMGADEFSLEPCRARIVPLSRGPAALWLLPALGLILVCRRIFRRAD